LLKTFSTIGFTLAAFTRPYFGRAHIEAYRLRKIRSLVRHAGIHVPYYRDLFDRHGVNSSSIKSLADFREIPVTEKQSLREIFHSISRERIDSEGLIEHKTSGSTGMPVHILRSPSEERRLNMLNWRLQRMWGLNPGDRLARVKTTWEPLSDRFNRVQHVARSVNLLNIQAFDCFQHPAENYKKILDFQPHVISGYPSSLVRIALQHAEQKGALKYLRRITCGGENLAPHQRRILEQCFAVPVRNSYGTSETNLAAWQCPESNLFHVCDDGVLLEVCRDGIPVAEGQSGEVVITSLHSHTMPIIRYSLGDRAVAGPASCPCGSPFSTVREIQGRTIDFLPLADGSEMHPFELLNEIVLESSDWLLEYQVVQEKLNQFRLLIVPRRPVSSDEEARFRAALLQVLGPENELQIEWSDQIDQEGAAKLHFCRSEIR